jgi:phosphomannomutase/phosphoglucomutase
MSNLNPPIPPAIFRAYDIRGVVDQQLNADNVALISQAIGSEAIDLGIRSLLVARDGRLSSPLLSEVLVAGLRQSGLNVVGSWHGANAAAVFRNSHLDIDSGVMLTASHNPANYNGLKIVFRKTSLAANQIQNIRARIDSSQLHFGAGDYRQEPIVDRYIEEVGQRLSLQRRMKIVIDCGHAVPAIGCSAAV